MRNPHPSHLLLLPLLLALLLVSACSDQPGDTAAKTATETTPASPPETSTQQVEGVIARVGDETISFDELNTMLNSSAMVGLSIPALGTPERNQVIITLLDKAISANLLYLEAKEQGVDRSERYLADLGKLEDAVLASMYESKVLIGELPVSEEEIQTFYKSSISPETELNDDVKLAIEASLRNQKLADRRATMQGRLRDGVRIEIDKQVLDPDGDSERKDTDIVATVDDRRISWGEVKMLMQGADQRAAMAEFYIDADKERLRRLDRYVDNALMAMKGRAAGLEQDPDFARRTDEYRKTQLINIHRDGLIHGWLPSDDESAQYYLDHQESIAIPEARKVQMVVLGSKEEAEKIKAEIDSGKLTLFQAAQQYSIDPNAKRTLGDMGWVSHGTGFKALDDFTFGLEPEVVGGPVESPAGWHLVKVLEVTDAQYQNIDDAETRRRTLRAYMNEKLNDYVVGLRKDRFKVVVYDDELTRQFQKEADFIAELNRKAVEEGSLTGQRQQELQKWIAKPPQ